MHPEGKLRAHFSALHRGGTAVQAYRRPPLPIRRIARHLGVDLARAGARAIPPTEKITPDSAVEYERRFDHEHREFCQTWGELRGTAPCAFAGIPARRAS